MSVPTPSSSLPTRAISTFSATSSSRATSACASMICVIDRALESSSASRARAVSRPRGGGVRGGVRDAVGLDDALAEAPGEPDGLGDGDDEAERADADAAPDGDAPGLFAGDGDTL